MAQTAAALGSRLEGALLDIACGSGRNALFLSALGHRVHGVDASGTRIRDARRGALDLGCSATFEVFHVTPWCLPPGPWGAVVGTHFLDRALLQRLPQVLSPGALVLWKTHLAHASRPASSRPRNPAYLLRSGELLRLFRRSRVLTYAEWAHAGQAYAAIAARLQPL